RHLRLPLRPSHGACLRHRRLPSTPIPGGCLRWFFILRAGASGPGPILGGAHGGLQRRCGGGDAETVTSRGESAPTRCVPDRPGDANRGRSIGLGDRAEKKASKKPGANNRAKLRDLRNLGSHELIWSMPISSACLAVAATIQARTGIKCAKEGVFLARWASTTGPCPKHIQTRLTQEPISQ
ncbi:unnamed protein product, partial [Urochloa humidicola]